MSFSSILIKASAGSGKTFQLSNRYLQLIFQGVPPETILATTFTRKAAGEILDRILQRLAEAAFDKKKRRELSQYVRNSESSNNSNQSSNNFVEISQEEILGTLAKLVRNVHRLRVSTLDSFFQQIAGNIGLELGLPPNWVMLEEDDRSPLLLEGIQRLLEELGKEKACELVHLLFKGESRARVTDELTALLTDLEMVYAESTPDAWRQLQRAKELNENEIQRLLVSLAQAEIALTKKQEPNQLMLKARNNDLETIRAALENGQKISWAEIGGKGLSQKALDGSYYYGRAEMPDSLCAVYDEIVRQVRAVVINRLATQTESMAEILGELTARVNTLKYQERLFDFSDVTYRLAKASIDGLYHRISHRIDAHTYHLLLDEFQDTSPSQWLVLLPFAKRIVHPQTSRVGTSFFCVGDVKQAIYGWRGGVAAIFDAIENDLGKLDEMPLNTSYRSSPQVIETVNQTFGTLGVNAALQGDSDDPKKQQDALPLIEAAEHWAKRFATHRTQRTSFAGYCSLRTSKLPQEQIDENGEMIKPSSDERKLAHLKYVVHEILTRHANAPTASIGVLTRTNQTVRQIIHGLREKGVEASEEGGNPLDQSPAVELILSALSLADYPANKVARFHLANSVLAERLGVTLKNYRNEQAMQFASLQIRRRLAVEGYATVLSDWTAALAPICDARDLGRLVQLLELASVYQRKAKIRTTPFIELVRAKKVESPSASPVRVTSIHKSKGLQFDIVILPELETKLTGTFAPKVVSGRDNPTSLLTTVLAYPSKDILAYLPERFQTLTQANETERIEESLCVLYVAMTRAVHELLMIVMPKEESGAAKKKNNDDDAETGKGKFAKTLAGILHAALAPEQSLSAEDSLLYQHGDANWIKKQFGEPTNETALETALETTSATEENVVIRLAAAPKNPMKNLKRETPSGMEGTFGELAEFANVEEIAPRERKESVAATLSKRQAASSERDRKQRDKNLGMLWGTALHACFEQVEWLDRRLPDRERLTDVVRQITREQLDAAEILDAFYRSCEQPEIRAALSLATYRQPCGVLENPHLHSAVHCSEDAETPYLQWEVHGERRFSVLSQPDTLLQGSMDRLTLLYDARNNQRRILGADVLDFKSDRIADDAELTSRIQFYLPQLLEYQKAAAIMFRLSKEQISTRLLFTSVGRVVRVK
ncbi:MAG: UvrD-helicase domain-containing protein [Planctomycetaceae bacterium]|jgi:ATP-dependent exoDNAse (exonuclease V) beta subunit|nr:UvrD-helicase domain-containing protein [Planctomycetaceae bacterium]